MIIAIVCFANNMKDIEVRLSHSDKKKKAFERSNSRLGKRHFLSEVCMLISLTGRPLFLFVIRGCATAAENIFGHMESLPCVQCWVCAHDYRCQLYFLVIIWW